MSLECSSSVVFPSSKPSKHIGIRLSNNITWWTHSQKLPRNTSQKGIYLFFLDLLHVRELVHFNFVPCPRMYHIWLLSGFDILHGNDKRVYLLSTKKLGPRLSGLSLVLMLNQLIFFLHFLPFYLQFHGSIIQIFGDDLFLLGVLKQLQLQTNIGFSKGVHHRWHGIIDENFLTKQSHHLQ